MSISVLDSGGTPVLLASAVAEGSLSLYRNLNAGPTGDVVKATPGQINGGMLFNLNAAVRFLKLYDKASAPTSSDTPKFTIPLSANGEPVELPGAVCGFAFAAGISIRATTGAADSDTGAPTANETIVHLLYS
jgi:hypothetical protein